MNKASWIGVCAHSYPAIALLIILPCVGFIKEIIEGCLDGAINIFEDYDISSCNVFDDELSQL